MIPRLQPAQSFKAIQGTFARDPVPPGNILALSATADYVFSVCDAGGADADHLEQHASAGVYTPEGQVVSSIRLQDDLLVNCGSISGDGSVAVAGCQQGRLHIWQGRTDKVLATLGETESLNSICDVDVGVMGDSVVSTSFRDDSVRVWDAGQERAVQTFASVLDRRARGAMCRIQGDGRRVFACDMRAVHVLDRRSGQKTMSLDNAARVLGGLGNFISAMDVDRTGRTVVAMHWPRNTLCIWDVRMRRVRESIRLRGSHGTTTVGISRGGERVVCSVFPPEERDRLTVVVDVTRGKVSHRLLHADERTVASAVSAGGGQIATLSRDGVARVFQVEGGEKVTEADLGKGGGWGDK